MEKRIYLQQKSELLSAMSHPARLEILTILRQGEACVCHIQAILEQRQAYVSQHLNILKHAGLVTSRKDGLRVYYRVSDPKIYTILDGAQNVLSAREIEAPPAAQILQSNHPCSCPECSTVTLN